MSEPKVLDLLTAALVARHRSPRTIEAYRSWLIRFVRHHGLRNPRELGTDDINRFLTHLATDLNVAPSTQTQACSALLFFYKEVLKREIGPLDIVRARKPATVVVALTPDEAAAVIDGLRGDSRLVVLLIYGSGLRLSEALGLRVKDIDLDQRVIHVRHGKGARDRVTMLADTVIDPLRAKLARTRARWEKDKKLGGGWAPLPYAFDRKSPSAGRAWGWQWVFPGKVLHGEPNSGRRWRAPLHPSGIQRAVKAAAEASGIDKRVTSHTFRHSFATGVLDSGANVRVLQKLLGHKDLKTTMKYTHVAREAGLGIQSPADRLRLQTHPPDWPPGRL